MIVGELRGRVEVRIEREMQQSDVVSQIGLERRRQVLLVNLLAHNVAVPGGRTQLRMGNGGQVSGVGAHGKLENMAKVSRDFKEIRTCEI